MRNNLFSIIKKEIVADNDSRPSSPQANGQTPTPDLVKVKNGIKYFEDKNSTKNHINTSTHQQTP